MEPDKSPGDLPLQNDLNVSDDTESIEDNTKVPDIGNRRGPSRRRFRKYTLSIIEKELHEAKRIIEAKKEARVKGDNIIPNQNIHSDNAPSEQSDNRSSETLTKTPYVPSDEAIPRPRARSETSKVYARYVQEGDRNLMLIYEPKESKSEVYCKQIGNKNVMVHLNVSSNLCQLIDRDNKGIIPLDSEGEVWLEIRRRSQVLNRDGTSDMMSLSENVFEDRRMYSKPRQGNQYVVNSLRSDSYVEGKVPGREATENACDMDSDDPYELEENEESPYQTISVIERGDSLMMKFEKWNQHGVLNPDKLSASPILSHKKVLDFLNDKGNNFDVSICDWGYEKEESVYSYISSNLSLMDISGDYTEVTSDLLQRRPRAREPEEHSVSSFGECLDHGYDVPVDVTPQPQNEFYSKVDKRGPLQNTHGAKQVAILYRREESRTKDGVELTRSVSDPNHSERAKKEEASHEHLVTRNSYPDESRKQSKVSCGPPNRKTDLTEYKWYHGNIEKSLAKERLIGREHGSFLVRDASNSSNSSHQYTIEFMDGSKVKKLMIMNTKSKYHFKEYEDKKFDRVDQLIQTIMHKGLEVKDSGTDIWKNIKVKPVSHL